MSKILGYIICLISLVLLTSTVILELKDFFQNTLKLPINQFSQTTIIIISLVIVAIGILVVSKSKSSSSSGHKNLKGKELPIYKGREIVGYRKH